MGKREDDIGRKKTPIEQIFQNILKREMTPQERRILLGKPRKTVKSN